MYSKALKMDSFCMDFVLTILVVTKDAAGRGHGAELMLEPTLGGHATQVSRQLMHTHT